MGGELLAHARRPELSDVIGDAGDGILALGLSAKKVADIIRHLHQVFGTAVLIGAHGDRLAGNEHISTLE